MSQYATTTDLASYGLPSAALTPVSSPDQTSALVAASGIIDGYISSRFSLPLSSWGDDLKIKTAEIAAYLILKKRGWTPGASDAEQIRLSYEDAISWLKDVAKGIATPYGVVQAASGSTPTDSGQDAPFVLQPAPGGFASSGGFLSKASDSLVEVGTPIAPRLRGW